MDSRALSKKGPDLASPYSRAITSLLRILDVFQSRMYKHISARSNGIDDSANLKVRSYVSSSVFGKRQVGHCMLDFCRDAATDVDRLTLPFEPTSQKRASHQEVGIDALHPVEFSVRSLTTSCLCSSFQLMFFWMRANDQLDIVSMSLCCPVSP